MRCDVMRCDAMRCDAMSRSMHHSIIVVKQAWASLSSEGVSGYARALAVHTIQRSLAGLLAF
jgi:hypothetical protein